MRKRYIFIHRQRTGRGRMAAVAVLLLIALAVWANTLPDPQLPAIYLKAAPVDIEK
jgi:hypothetical protein